MMTEDFWGNIRKGLEEGLIAAADCAELLAQQGRVRLDVAVAKQQIQRLFAEVGKMVHEQSKDAETVAISVEMRKSLDRLSDLMDMSCGKMRRFWTICERSKEAWAANTA